MVPVAVGQLSWTCVPEQLVAAPVWDPAPLLGQSCWAAPASPARYKGERC